MTPPEIVRFIVTNPKLRKYHADRILLWLYPTLADGLPHRVEVRRTAARLQIHPQYVRAGLAELEAAGCVRFIGTDNQNQRWYMLRREGFTTTTDTEMAA